MLPLAGNAPPNIAATPLRKTVTVDSTLAGLVHEFSEPSLFSATAANATLLANLESQFAGETLVSRKIEGLLDVTASMRVVNIVEPMWIHNLPVKRSCRGKSRGCSM